MEEIKYLKRYNTDTFGPWSLQNFTLDINTPFEEVLKFTIIKKAHLIIKPSRGNYWYIKGMKETSKFSQIEYHIENNQQNKYKPKSTLWLIDYI